VSDVVSGASGDTGAWGAAGGDGRGRGYSLVCPEGLPQGCAYHGR
jgi:hypothetical protein